MTYTTRRSTFLQQLNAIAKRANQWARIRPISFDDRPMAIVHHVGTAY